jgi:hypothetical protein
MNGPGGNPGQHQGAETSRSTPWKAQQYFAAQDYETNLPAAIDWDVGRQQVRLIQLSQNSSLNFPINPKRGATYMLFVKQDATGSRTLSYTAQLAQLGSGTWKWPNATTPTLTTAAGKIDVLTFVFDGTHMIGVSSLNF